MTTKLHTLTDAQGRPLRFILTGGEAHDSTTAADLLDGRTTGLIAEKAYDNNALCELIPDAGAAVVISSLSSRKIISPHDRPAYRLRNRIERFFNKVKHFRHIATRYDRRAVHFLGALHLASTMI